MNYQCFSDTLDAVCSRLNHAKLWPPQDRDRDSNKQKAAPREGRGLLVSGEP
jgi:hypothetical protein